MNPTLSPDQIKQYNTSQGSSTNPLSPSAWLKTQESPLPAFSTNNLTPADPLKLPAVPGVTTPDQMAGLLGGNAESLATMLKTIQAPTAAETGQTDLRKSILESLNTLNGKTAATLNLQNEKGLPEMTKQLTDVVGQLQTLQKESLAIPLQIQQESEGRGRTAGGVEPLQAGRLRENAIKSLSLSAIGQTLQGNITLAQSQIDRAIALQFEPEEKKLQFLQQVYTFNQQDLQRQDTKKSEALRILIDERARILDNEKINKNEIYSIGLTAQKFGADPATVQKVFAAKTREEAVSLAGSSLQDPKAKIDLDNARLDTLLKKAQIAKVQKETSLLGQPTPAETKATVAAIKEAKASIPVMQDKVMAVDVLKKAPGLDSRVGPNILSRGGAGFGAILKGGIVGAGTGALAGSFIPGLGNIAGLVGGGIAGALAVGGQGAADSVSGAGQDFSGGVHKLVAGLTIQNLQDAKARGATFGALSEGELSLLASSATAINDWEVKDDKGRGLGYWNIDEGSFNKELDTIKTLTQRALQQSQGTILTPDEKSILDALYQVTEDAVDPGRYY